MQHFAEQQSGADYISYNKNLKRKEWDYLITRDEINERKELYSNFLAEAYRLSMIAFQIKLSDLKEFDLLTKYYSQIELLSEEKLINAAKSIYTIIPRETQSGQKEYKIHFL